MYTEQLVRSVQALLSDPTHWIRGAYARDESGEVVHPHSPHAVCWCLAGAFFRAGASLETVFYIDTILSFYTQNKPRDRCHTALQAFNDSVCTTYADIHAFLAYLLTTLEE